ncbi:unnamed protein product [Clonostachys solani]|uniref:Uncharacterized protein n=1 Tax=Clonostachys solani TaxID=160281 RepID=A0A9N9Z3I6_9HYPO|nr:unnamed protein product [Clonostachys solani]
MIVLTQPEDTRKIPEAGLGTYLPGSASPTEMDNYCARGGRGGHGRGTNSYRNLVGTIGQMTARNALHKRMYLLTHQALSN